MPEWTQFVWKTVLPYLGVAGMIASVALQLSGYTNQKLAKILFVTSALVLIVPLLIASPWRKIGQYVIEHRGISIILIAIAGSLISAGAATVFLPSKKIKLQPSQISDFKATVIRYGCIREKNELFADVQYVNTGPIRRTVFTVALTTRAKDEKNSQHPLINNSLDNTYGNEPPLYVDPNQPIVVRYRYKLENDEINLIKIPGQVFGLLFTIINSDGTMNFVTIEAMLVEEVANTLALASTSRRDISLDVRGGYTRMENPIMQPSLTPDKGVSPP